MARPPLRVLARQRDRRVEAVQFLPVDEVVPRARRVQQPRGNAASTRAVVAEHRPKWDDARAAAYQEERAAKRLLPDEVASDRAAQLELVTSAQLIRQVGRHLPVVELLNGQDEIFVL